MSLVHSLATQLITIVHDTQDAAARPAPMGWAVQQLIEAIARAGGRAELRPSIAPSGRSIFICGASSPAARELLAGRVTPDQVTPAESLAIVPVDRRGQAIIVALGADARGIVYAVMELIDRVRHATSASGLFAAAPRIQRPLNPIRGVVRTFQSELEDKPWFYDREFWQDYLTMLIERRFNRVQLCLGLGYDYPYVNSKEPRESYLDFAYPFLVDVRGSGVAVRELPDPERRQNLEMLKWISEQAVLRGLDFQLGLWSHAFDWPHAPAANYTITGLTAQNHAAYCRDALGEVLQACPSITGVTFRAHYESGIPEGTHAFWRTVWDGLSRARRPVELDIHAKGIDFPLIDIARATGQRVTVSPKFWAEHMGLAYQPSSVRESERHTRAGENTLAQAARRFMRYSYGDVMREDRGYKVLFRVWPGTQRVLLWGDAEMAAGYSRAAGFCGADGLELFEPLSFKGRMGSGLAGGRDGYADASLKTDRDYEKHETWYRLFGRLLYDVDEQAEVLQRPLRQFGPSAAACEKALSAASRILPLITTAHLPSAANKHYWPEMYVNMPIVDAKRRHPYHDTPEPKDFCSVSAIDPSVFASIDELADAIVKGEPLAKIAPLEVADWLDGLCAEAEGHLSGAGERDDAAFRRLSIDVAVQCDLGRFFAAKLRAGVCYALFVRTQRRDLLSRAIVYYRGARDAWMSIIERTRGIYAADLTFGPEAHNRGHWSDRLPAIEQDISDMDALLARTPAGAQPEAALAWHRPPMPAVRHTPPAGFVPDRPVRIEASCDDPKLAMRLHYRQVDQSQPYRVLEMQRTGASLTAEIPADYADASRALMYRLELRRGAGAWFSPALTPPWTTPPYIVLRPKTAQHSAPHHV